MAELATPVRYNIPMLEFKPAQVGVEPLEIDKKGLAKAQIWGSIANAIKTLPDTILKGYAIEKDKAKTARETEEYERKKQIQDMALAEFQAASAPSAVAVDSTVNADLGVTPGQVGGAGFPTKLVSDFEITPAGVSYKPTDPAERAVKLAYYNRLAGKTADGVTFPSVEAATAAGYNPQGGTLHPDGSITIKEFKTREEKGGRLTEGEQKTSIYVKRATAANANVESILRDYDPTGIAGVGNTIAREIPIVGNFLVGSDAQKLNQAADEFATAILRKDTGAAISKGERAEVYRTYIPQPGDDTAVLAQKAEARKRAIAALQESLPQVDQARIAATNAGVAPIPPGVSTPLSTTPPATQRSGKVHVRRNSDGATGWMDADDPALKSGKYIIIE